MMKKEEWDFSQAEKRDPVKSNRVVVSVAFSRTDFQLVAKLAQKLGEKTSGFIRRVAVDKASCKTWFATCTGNVQMASTYLPNITTSLTKIIYR